MAGDRPSDHCPPIDFAPPRLAADDSWSTYYPTVSMRPIAEITVLRAPESIRIDKNYFSKNFYGKIGESR